MLEECGAVRDVMMEVLRIESGRNSGGRQLLLEIFAGECRRVARARALLEVVLLLKSQQCLAEKNDGDQRPQGGVSACESVEQVLRDLGLTYALKRAQEQERERVSNLIRQVQGDDWPPMSPVLDVPVADMEEMVPLDPMEQALDQPTKPLALPFAEDAHPPNEDTQVHRMLDSSMSPLPEEEEEENGEVPRMRDPSMSPPLEEEEEEEDEGLNTTEHSMLQMDEEDPFESFLVCDPEQQPLEAEEARTPEPALESMWGSPRTSMTESLRHFEPEPVESEPPSVQSEAAGASEEPFRAPSLSVPASPEVTQKREVIVLQSQSLPRLRRKPNAQVDVMSASKRSEAFVERLRRTSEAAEAQQKRRALALQAQQAKKGAFQHGNYQPPTLKAYQRFKDTVMPAPSDRKARSLPGAECHAEPMREPSPGSERVPQTPQSAFSPPLRSPEAQGSQFSWSPRDKAARLDRPPPSARRGAQSSGSRPTTPGGIISPGMRSRRLSTAGSSDDGRVGERSTALTEMEEEESLPPTFPISLNSLSPAHRDLVRQIFAHYVGPGGMSAGTGLGMTRFRQLLRDCGLLGGPSSGGEDSELSQAEADLILSRACGATAAGLGQTRLMSADALVCAFVHIASRGKPAPVSLNTAIECMEVLCTDTLSVFAEQLLNEAGRDVLVAVTIMGDPEVSRLLKRCQQGFANTFARYASGVGALEPYRRGHMTARSISKFAAEAGVVADLSISALHQVFGAAAAYEARAGRGTETKLSLPGFVLAVVVIAQRVYANMRNTPLSRLVALLLRVSVQVPGAHDLKEAARAARKEVKGGSKPILR
eukprot:TRINITY_DN21689_c0_g1_i1.p1 TRINITY_DN21689_c0_g1~~TRINITY_DN21689_c0_g1_i1.p1  ORF type:complete len:868 (-),score=191.57 TRINITY_DN21689_c0_g1_i1:39-2507(-)